MFIRLKLNINLLNNHAKFQMVLKNYDESVKYNRNWPYIPDHAYRILIIHGSGSEKTNALLNINDRIYIDRIYLYVKEPFESANKYLSPEEKK